MTSVSIKVSDDFQTFKLSDGTRADLDGLPIAELKRVVKRMRPTVTDLSFHYNTISPDAEIYVLDLLDDFKVDFKALDLTVGKSHSRVEDAIVAKLLTGNPTPESLTLRVHSEFTEGSETLLRKILTPFMFHRVEDETRRARVKKLVLVSIVPNSQGTPIEHVLKQVIEHNDVLEHLEVGDGVFAPSVENTNSINSTALKAEAIRMNKTLKVLRLQCTSPEFKQIVARCWLASGDRKPNTTLRTLRVSLRDFEKLVWWDDLVELVASTRTLEHVEVSQGMLGPRDTVGLKTKLQRLCDKELKARKRASSNEKELQSVTVGWWKAVLNAGKWEIADSSGASS